MDDNNYNYNCRTVTRLLQPNMYVTSLDLTDAYLFIPIHSSLRKYLRFKFEQNLYEFTALPFGLAIVPNVFSKITRLLTCILKVFYASNI